MGNMSLLFPELLAGKGDLPLNLGHLVHGLITMMPKHQQCHASKRGTNDQDGKLVKHMRQPIPTGGNNALRIGWIRGLRPKISVGH